MENCCNPKLMALKLLILGVILILVRLYTAWDIWIVLGVLVIIKAFIVFAMPAKNAMPAKRRR